MFKLKSNFKPSGDQPKAIKELVKSIKSGNRFQTLLGATGTGKTFTIANVISQLNQPVLVMAPNKALAAQLYREYKNFFPENSVNYFVSYYDYYQPEAYIPNSDTYIEKEAMINQEIDKLRHQATSALMTRKDVIIVASVSCIYNLGLPASYFESVIKLEKNKEIVRGDLIRQLVKIQFERTNGELERGNFRVRGDIFEIMPASGGANYILDISNQKVSKLALVDPLTKSILEEPDEILIFPPKHFIASEPERKKAIIDIKKELKERLKYFKDKGLLLEAERLERRTKYDMEMLKSIGYCHGIENYSRHLTGKLSGEAPDTLLSYFPKNPDGSPDFLTVIDESHIGVPQIRGMYEGDRSRKNNLVNFGWRLPSALDNRPLKFDEFLERIGKAVFTSATPGQWELDQSLLVTEQIIRPTGLIDPEIEVRPVSPVLGNNDTKTQIEDLIEELEKVVNSEGRAIVNTLTKKMAEDLHSYLREKGFKAEYIHSDVKTIERTDILVNFRKGRFDILVGVNLLREGLDLPEVVLVAILDADREGFLRSDTSLIQTMGRASRNVSGKVILYADKITGSIKRAMDEVERRRKKQLDYNKKNNITPKTIKKTIENLLDFEED